MYILFNKWAETKVFIFSSNRVVLFHEYIEQKHRRCDLRSVEYFYTLDPFEYETKVTQAMQFILAQIGYGGVVYQSLHAVPVWYPHTRMTAVNRKEQMSFHFSEENRNLLSM